MKCIIAILEGISPQWLYAFMDHGRLPNFDRLCRTGKTGELVCNPIPYEAAGITSAFSGVSEQEHGIVSYWKPVNPDYIPVLWESSDVRGQMFWNHEPYRHLNYRIVNIFGTQPTYPIQGKMLSYSMVKNLKFSYPPSLTMELYKKKIPYLQDTAVFYTPTTVQKTFVENILMVDRRRKDSFLHLIDEDTDVAIVNFTQIDRLSHFYFRELEDGNPLDSSVYLAYQQSDDFLGELMDTAERMHGSLLVFSEIGFGRLQAFVEVNDYLFQSGLLRRSDGKSVDYENSTAFESVQGTHGVNIHTKNRYRHGLIGEDEYENVLQHTMNLLRKMPNPHNDQPMFSRVTQGRGYAETKNLPDILMEPYDWEYLPYGDPYWAGHVTRHHQTGWHRTNSFWGYWGNYPHESGLRKIEEIHDLIVKEIQ